MAQDKEEISRVIRSKKDARISYDRMSRLYNFLAGPWEKKFQEKGLENLGIMEGEVVLEIEGILVGRQLLVGRLAFCRDDK
jgi:hypothetical protein